MFTGLSAFPLTPVKQNGIDEAAFTRLVERLAIAGVDSIGVLGSTGNYAYLSHAERARTTRLAVAHAGNVPVMVGISALRTRDVLALSEDAQAAGAQGVLLAPMSYQVLSEEEVYGFYQEVCAHLSVPLCVYDNPGTTRFTFTDELHGRIAALPNVASIKIPGVPKTSTAAKERVEHLKATIPPHVTVGVSGDAMAATGLNAGCDAWYSVMGGLFPEAALAITHAAQAGNKAEAQRLSEQLQPLWELFAQHDGSLRVIASAAELLGRVEAPCLPLPLKALEGNARRHLATLLDTLKLT